MRKRSKYKPKPIITNNIEYVVSGMKKLANLKDVMVSLQLKNHFSLEALRVGDATKEDIDIIMPTGIRLISNERYTIYRYTILEPQTPEWIWDV